MSEPIVNDEELAKMKASKGCCPCVFVLVAEVERLRGEVEDAWYEVERLRRRYGDA